MKVQNTEIYMESLLNGSLNDISLQDGKVYSKNRS